jgi:hypothetical protein
MTVSYSDYKFAVIQSGTESGTWGNYTNDNFQYAVQQAIGGYTSVSFASTTSVTLTPTLSNGLQPFRALYLNCTDAPGGAATLVVPAIQKLYIVKNATTGGYDITVKIGSSTGTTVPNGKTAFLYANGSDVVVANDWMSSLTTTSITASGAVTASGNFSAGTATTVSGTYSRSASSTSLGVTTASAHGLANGQQVYLNFTDGGATTESGVYTITVTGSTTFTVTTVLTTAVSGNVTTSSYANTVTLTAPISVPSAFGSSGTTGQFLASQGAGVPPKWTTLSTTSISQGDSNVTVTDTSTVTSGTYARSGFVVTVTTGSAHGFTTGQALSLTFTTGSATSGVYPITVTSSTQFTVTDTSSGTTSGNVTITTTGTITFVTDGSTRTTVGAASGAGILKTNAYRDATIALGSGTYGRSGTTVTVTTASAHGFSSGQSLNLTFSAGTGGTATSGTYSITVTGTTTFTITDASSGTITGGAVGIAPGSGFGFNGDIWYGV